MSDHTHDHYEIYGVAEEHHRHYTEEKSLELLQLDLQALQDRVDDLESELGAMKDRDR